MKAAPNAQGFRRSKMNNPCCQISANLPMPNVFPMFGIAVFVDILLVELLANLHHAAGGGELSAK
jgi:hypothetical protein